MIVNKQLVQKALALPEFDIWAAQRSMIANPRSRVRAPELPGEPRQGAVLLLLHQWQGENALVLTKRPDTMRDHAGQISFPGGSCDPNETLKQAALRETCEEVGICSDKMELLGELTPIYIPPTDFLVHPFVAWYEGAPLFRPNRAEVAELIQTTLSQLLEPTTRRQEEWDIRGYRMMVPFFQLDGHKVWGATAIIMAEFLGRLEQVTGLGTAYI